MAPTPSDTTANSFSALHGTADAANSFSVRRASFPSPPDYNSPVQGPAAAPEPPVGSARNREDLLALCQRWPQLDELRRAARGSALRSKPRWLHARSSLAASTRMEFAAALRASCTRSRRRAAGSGPAPLRDEVGWSTSILGGLARHETIGALLAGDLALLAGEAQWSTRCLEEATVTLRSLIGTPVVFSVAALPCMLSLVTGSDSVCEFPHAHMLFGGALACGWPWALSLQLFSGLGAGWFSDDGRTFRSRSAMEVSTWSHGRSLEASDAVWSYGTISASAYDHNVGVYFCDGLVVALCSNKSLRIARAEVRSMAALRRTSAKGRTYYTRFYPEWLRLPRDNRGFLVFPKTHVTSVIERRFEWIKVMGNVDGATWAILSGQMSYPREELVLRQVWLPNHASWEQDAVKEKLGPKYAAYLVQGALEAILGWMRNAAAIFNPAGSVPKKGPDLFRAIADARLANLGVGDWGVRLFTVLEVIDMLDWCYIAFGEDLGDGYHASVFGGCTGELVWGWGVTGVEEYTDDDGVQCQRPVWGYRLHVGCSPADCLGTCEKACSALCLDGCAMRWAVAHFGQKCAGSPLNVLAMCFLRYLARRGMGRNSVPRPIQGAVWVDDFIFVKPVERHPPCAGLEGGCVVCRAVLPGSEADHRYVVDLGDRLGLGFSESKRQYSGQKPEYSGFQFDTVQGRLRIMADKLPKMESCLEEWVLSAHTTARNLAKIRGKALHFSLGISHLRVLVPEISLTLGTESDPDDKEHGIDWDREITNTEGMLELGLEILRVIRKGASEGAEMWPPHPSTLYSRFLRGRYGDARLFVLTWDAGPNGYAALLRWWQASGDGSRELKELLLVGTWPKGAEVEHQAHREILAACLATESAAQQVDLHGSVVLFRNDAEAAIAALRKGSFQSPVMQRSAVRLNRLLFSLDVVPRMWHVPGLALVAEGVDGASRGGGDLGDECVDYVLGPAVGDELWEEIETVLRRIGWGVTIDLFATASNARCARYCSRTHEPGAERTDAFTMLDWSSSECPLCRQTHREVVYAYPPTVLARRVVNKAMQDGARMVLVVPLAVTAPHWQKLRKYSLIDNADRYLRVKNARAGLRHGSADDPNELAVFACDFSCIVGEADCAPSVGCVGPVTRRPRRPCGGGRDEEDRRRLRAELLRQVAEDGPAGAAVPH